MTDVLFYQEITEADRCPDCRGLLTKGVFRESDRTIWNICFACGYNCNKLFGRPSKHNKPSKNNQKDETGKDGVK